MICESQTKKKPLGLKILMNDQRQVIIQIKVLN